MSLRWVIFDHLAIVLIAIFLVVWFFHGQIFVHMYEASKTKNMEEIASELSEWVNEDGFEAKAWEAYAESGYSIRVFSKRGEFIFSSQSASLVMTPDEIADLYTEAYNQGGNRLTVSERETTGTGKQKFAQYAATSYPAENEYLFIIEGVLSPRPETVEESRFYVLGIVAVIGFAVCLFSFALSSEIVKPLRQMNAWPKKMAGETCDTAFRGGYREINEFNDSLDSAFDRFLKIQKYQREMLENTAHDLRTPLMMITCCTEMMRDFPEENTPENLRVVIDEIKRLSEIVDDMMDLSRLLEGRAVLTKTTFNLTESIKTKAELLRKVAEIYGLHISLETEEDVWVMADKIKIQQVLQNLIINAVKHTGPDKTVIIRQSVSGDRVRMEVTDSGKGIPSDRVPLIWERWSTYQNPQDRSIGIGTGLGLAIVKEILQLHGCAFGVISREGFGSTFWFELECFQKRACEETIFA